MRTPSRAFPAGRARHSGSSGLFGHFRLSGLSRSPDWKSNQIDQTNQTNQIDPLFIPLIPRLNS